QGIDMNLQSYEQKHQGVHDKSDVFPKRLQGSSGSGAHSSLRAKIADDQARRCRRNHPRQMQMIGKKIAAVGNDGGNGDLDLRIIDRLRDLARRVPQCRPENRSSYDSPEKLRNSISRAQSAGESPGKYDLEQDYRCS